MDGTFRQLAHNMQQQHRLAMLNRSPLRVIARLTTLNWRWFVFAIVVCVALRALSLGASCALDKSQTCSDWLFYGFLGPLRFQWVAKYKELIAGLLAFAAGGFVLIGTRLQINEARRMLASNKKEQADVTLIRMSTEFHHVDLKLSQLANSSIDNTLINIRSGIQQLFIINSEVAPFIDTMRFYCEERIREISAAAASGKPLKSDNARVKKAKLYAAIAQSILNNMRTNLDEYASYKIKPYKSAILPKKMKELGFKKDDLADFHKFIDIDATFEEDNSAVDQKDTD